jgi:hypothetical protein
MNALTPGCRVRVVSHYHACGPDCHGREGTVIAVVHYPEGHCGHPSILDVDLDGGPCHCPLLTSEVEQVVAA